MDRRVNKWPQTICLNSASPSKMESGKMGFIAAYYVLNSRGCAISRSEISYGTARTRSQSDVRLNQSLIVVQIRVAGWEKLVSET